MILRLDMFRFNELKLSQDPRQFGSLIKGYKKCGKKNCKCFTKGELHEYYCLKWRDFDIFNGKHKVHKQYIKKDEVAKLEEEQSKIKGFYIWNKLTMQQQSYFMLNNKNVNSETIWQSVYQVFKKPPYPIHFDYDINTAFLNSLM